MNRCDECYYWKVYLGTEKVGKCTFGGPSIGQFSDKARWPETERDEGCGQWWDGEKKSNEPVMYMNLKDLIKEKGK